MFNSVRENLSKLPLAKPRIATLPRLEPRDSGVPVILAGASVRALAKSARKSGFLPICVDFFADLDLSDSVANAGRESRLAPETFVPRTIRSFRDLPELIENIDSAIPLIWSGGLENHPELLKTIAEARPVPGVTSSCVKRLRDPISVFRQLTACGVAVAETVRTPPTDSEKWLRKPRCSGGGIGIEWCQATRQKESEDSDAHVCQRYIPGRAISALYSADRHQTTLLMLSKQLIGCPELHATGFQFCGNVAPVRLPGEVVSQIRQVGCIVAREYAMIGVFGIDFVISEAGLPVLIEINPRITASSELYDMACDGMHPTAASIFEVHMRACRGDNFDDDPVTAVHTSSAGPSDWKLIEPTRVYIRAILYAHRDAGFPDAWWNSPAAPVDTPHQSSAARSGLRWPDWLHDIPAAGSQIAAGQPVCSVTAAGSSESQAFRCLERRLELIHKMVPWAAQELPN